MNIYAVLFLFFGVYLSISIWIFLIVTDSIRKISLHGFFRAKRDFIESVNRQFILLSENKEVSEEEIVFLFNQMKNKKMKRFFLQRFIYFADRIPMKKRIKEYFKIAFPFVSEMIQCDKNMHYSERSYRLMLLGEFRQDMDETNRIVMEALEDDSFDVRTNALRAFSLIGNSSCFNRALIKACSSRKYFNSRHISEMIGTFEGNSEELKRLMMDSFYVNSDFYRYQVLVFLTENSCCSSLEFVHDYLQNHSVNKNNVIACLRFFSVCESNDKTRELIFKILQEEDVELRATSVKLTPKYFCNDREIITLLSGEGFLKSSDWYVRKNSAAALVGIILDKEVLVRNLLTDDQYAREALIYAMFDAGVTTYEEFIELRGDVNGNT